MKTNQIQVFGIRHHGPGSARSLLQALDRLEPTVVLVEGPPDADSLLALAVHEDMRPPVAILVYVPEEPRRCVYYPFAEFSPEWQAIRWAIGRNVPVRFMDLPQSVQLAMEKAEAEEAKAADEENQTDQSDLTDPTGQQEEEPHPNPLLGKEREPEGPVNGGGAIDLRRDPLRALAEAAGYGDGERWWDHMVEHRADATDVFDGIMEAMSTVRAEAERQKPSPPAPLPDSLVPRSEPSPPAPLPDSLVPRSGEGRIELMREAWMRQTIRAAQREGHERIAVVCGAWHAPALVDMGPAKVDKALLDGLPKVKTAASWIPWTYSRLSYRTGYGAGIESPGWYHHLWNHGGRNTLPGTEASTEGIGPLTPNPGGIGLANRQASLNSETTIAWLTKVAHLLREQDLDASPASVIEAVRLAECLAAIRGRPLPGLAELNEATQTVLCFGSDVPMRLIAEKLIVGETLGDVPADAPTVPLQQDLNRQQKRLRLPPEATQRVIDLDLRKANDLERSELLHRLALLGIPWGRRERGGGSKGTFHELWRLQWQPEFSIALIENGVWGNTVADASTAFASDRAENAPDLPSLTKLLEAVMLARLPAALRRLMERLEDASAHASDVGHLMQALPPLANVLRYGDVRGTDTSMVAHTIDGLVARICVGLPAACGSLDDDAALAMSNQIASTNGAVALLQNKKYEEEWRDTLCRLADRPNLHGRIGGQCARLLLDMGVFTAEEAGRHMSLALSTAVDPARAAAWVEGFLAGSGLLLVHDRTLWSTLDEWVSGLSPDHFTALLPLLRRTFSTFSAPERRQLGEQARSGRAAGAVDDVDDIDVDRAAQALPFVLKLLGISNSAQRV